MTSPYLDQPLIPLAIALPRMLAQVEAKLSTAVPVEEERLRQRAELLRGLMVSPTASRGDYRRLARQIQDLARQTRLPIARGELLRLAPN